ncbi:LacI family DNA-binding transcriptional regulator [Dysgonomonas sp. GY75]|uniref:LacI family DNA-binding transcriptional regulator n=1 Tax=Dysgonomonas sp. GY75 TaxID=2780419 RepID=UPI0018837494|nr:LacI family DNA-binding transcriptional regulator [Dysgonomonas sp. GY75]MBF0649999.1 LacI family DNA-binding transcriptional regulator [Dysgonomonas sp. GY75]
MKKRTSLKDIAEKLNLSKTTVSWVLNGQAEKKGISKNTQEIVLNCAKELHYQPNLIARSLNIGQTKTIGLILPSISDFFYSSIAREIENQANLHGYSLMIASSESDFNKEELVIQMFKSKGVDGIIIAPTKRSKVEIERLMLEKFPLVTFDRYFPELETSYIIIDNKESSYKLTKHLVSRGCKNIALITTNSYLTTMGERNEGYKQALLDSGIKFNPTLVGNVEYEDYETKIVKILDNIFEKVPDVDGFFFTTHILALEAFLYFNNRGIDFNRQFQLACIHGVSLFKILAPKINIARMPVSDIGKNAIDILLGEIREKNEQSGEKGQYKVVLPCTLYLNN